MVLWLTQTGLIIEAETEEEAVIRAGSSVRPLRMEEGIDRARGEITRLMDELLPGFRESLRR